MKTLRSLKLFVSVLLTLMVVQACVPTVISPATSTLTPQLATPTEPISPNQISEPATEVPPAAMWLEGQIAYIMNGNVWRYIFPNGESIQVTTQVWDGNYYTSYFDPDISPDGRYLAFGKHPDNRFFLSDLTDGTIVEITSYGEFLGWTGRGYEFFTAISNQKWVPDQIDAFKFYRYDLANLDSPELLASLSEQRKSPLSISSDGQWVSLNRDAQCPHPECRFDKLWNLPSTKEITPPTDIIAGHIDFAPDSKKLSMTVRNSDWYKESPLFVADIDMSALTPIVTQPQTRVEYAFWSPYGQWLALSAIEFDSSIVMSDSQSIVERRVMIVRPDGSELTRVEGGRVNLVGWSPDGSKLLYLQDVSFLPILYIYDIETGLKQPLPLIVHGPFDYLDWGNLKQ